MNEIIGAASQVGFPIVVALLLLIRIESKMEKLGQKIDTLSEAIVKLTTIFDYKRK